MKKSEQRAFEEFPEPSEIRTGVVTDEDGLRQAYIYGYEQAEKDINEELYNNENVITKADAVQYAFSLYEQFAENLITALANTGKYKNMVALTTTDPLIRIKAQAQADAFEEIKDRIKKEHHLIMQPTDGHWPIDEVYRKIKFSKNLDVDTLINEDKYRGRNDYHRLMVFKGKLADMLEHYACTSFDLGYKLSEMENKDEDIRDFDELVVYSLNKITKPCREDIEL